MDVLKIGGNELDAPGFLPALAVALAAAGRPVVVVHGGGRAIADLQTRFGLVPRKVDGLRVTDADSLALAEMALSGQANKAIVRALLAAGVDAIGLSGVDGGLLRCEQRAHPTADLGFVGRVVAVRATLLKDLLACGLTPVLSPISLGPEGAAYNVNADEVAAAVAAALDAEALVFVSNVPGVLRRGGVVPALSRTEAEALIADGTIADGMVPKVRAALDAVGQGVPRARIVDLAGYGTHAGTAFTAGQAPAPTTDRADRSRP